MDKLRNSSNGRTSIDHTSRPIYLLVLEKKNSFTLLFQTLFGYLCFSFNHFVLTKLFECTLGENHTVSTLSCIFSLRKLKFAHGLSVWWTVFGNPKISTVRCGFFVFIGEIVFQNLSIFILSYSKNVHSLHGISCWANSVKVYSLKNLWRFFRGSLMKKLRFNRWLILKKRVATRFLFNFQWNNISNQVKIKMIHFWSKRAR